MNYWVLSDFIKNQTEMIVKSILFHFLKISIINKEVE